MNADAAKPSRKPRDNEGEYYRPPESNSECRPKQSVVVTAERNGKNARTYPMMGAMM
jgi:hypothetical protein